MLFLLITALVLIGAVILVGDLMRPEGVPRIQWTFGALLFGGAVLVAAFWLMVVLSANEGAFRVGGYSGSGLWAALLATPSVLALSASQAVFGVGLMRGRPWVRWYGLAFVLGGIVAGALTALLPQTPLLSLSLPLIPALPLGGFLLRPARHGAGRPPGGPMLPTVRGGAQGADDR